ncbi:MAG: acetate uptake transporter [Deltaproteobacteria bacterium]|nr:acetate uptake transporter [Deltaproteobacteria bacterium]
MPFKLANPGPLGLAGFGMTTILLNLHNAGFFPNSSVVLGMGLFFGGLAQMLAGAMEFTKGNTFGTVAFTSYGAFWLSLVAVWVLPKIGWAEAPSPAFMGCYLFIWGVFTLLMFVGTLKSGPVLRFVFLSLAVLFFLLALGDFTENHSVTKLAGWVGIVCGASALYLSMAEVLAESHGKKILPH